MKLPRSVQLAAEQAEALQAEIVKATQTPASDEPPPQEELPIGSQSQEQPPATSEPQPEPPVDATMEQRYNSLQGIAAAQAREIKELRAQLSEIDRLKQRLQELESANVPDKSGPSQPTSEQVAQDAADFGEDLVQMVARQAVNAVTPMVNVMIARLAQRLDALESSTKQTTEVIQQSQAEKFYADLKRLVPDYETFDQDPRWRNWLAETDLITGKVRQELLSDAVQAMSAERTAAMFNECKRQLGVVPTAPKSSTDGRASSLDKHVSPQTSGESGAPFNPQAKPVYTAADIDRMAKQCVTLRRTNPQKAREIEAIMDAAMAEGRVTP